jgi:hypothetical protein
MRQRCENEKSEAFPDYGGRGIKVCDRWQEFDNFLADMGECPPGMSIDRINNGGGYEPGNCRWASTKEQASNRRNSLVCEHDGKSMTLKELGELIGVPYKVMHHRYSIGKRGPALVAPLRKDSRRKQPAGH